MRNGAAALLILTGAAFSAPVTVVALGDSLTQGFGLPTQDGLVPQLQAWLTAQGRDVTMINAGVSGDTTAGGLSRVDWSLTPDVDAVIVELGGNDFLRGIDPAVSRANLDKILAAATARQLPVLLIGIRASGNYGPEYRDAFDAMYTDLATQYDTLLIDNYFQPLGLGNGQTSIDPALMQADGIHPNAAGVAKVVATYGPRVIELLDKVAP